MQDEQMNQNEHIDEIKNDTNQEEHKKQQRQVVQNLAVNKNKSWKKSTVTKIEAFIMFAVLIMSFLITIGYVQYTNSERYLDVMDQTYILKANIADLETKIDGLEEKIDKYTQDMANRPIDVTINMNGNANEGQPTDPNNPTVPPVDEEFDTRPFLGVSFVEGENSADELGLRIIDVVPNSPASFAGIQIGDVILSIDGQSINDFETLSAIIDSHQANDTITIKLATVIDGAIGYKTVDVTLTYRGNFDFEE